MSRINFDNKLRPKPEARYGDRGQYTQQDVDRFRKSLDADEEVVLALDELGVAPESRAQLLDDFNEHLKSVNYQAYDENLQLVDFPQYLKEFAQSHPLWKAKAGKK